VLLPIAPAFVLYKLLPSEGEASGPVKGLSVRFKGAFAGYLVVFMLVLYTTPTETNHYHTWTVEGRVTALPGAGEAIPNLNDLFIRIVPPRLGVMNGGVFSWEVPVVEDASGVLHFPDLQLDLRGYQGVTVALQPGRSYGSESVPLVRDDKQRVLRLNDPITLRSIAAERAYVGVPTVAVPLTGVQ
jgi:hypothetical protein